MMPWRVLSQSRSSERETTRPWFCWARMSRKCLRKCSYSVIVGSGSRVRTRSRLAMDDPSPLILEQADGTIPRVRATALSHGAAPVRLASARQHGARGAAVASVLIKGGHLLDL